MAGSQKFVFPGKREGEGVDRQVKRHQRGPGIKNILSNQSSHCFTMREKSGVPQPVTGSQPGVGLKPPTGTLVHLSQVLVHPGALVSPVT